ncbi:hypothetical protein CBS101457_001429 [Exobasidium rhododendri]|nr:hypothetical protein CBS101457_001429 [Exobasidium rhododendri]
MESRSYYNKAEEVVDDDDDGSEDWNVYDDFNNARSSANGTPSTMNSKRDTMLKRTSTGDCMGYLDASNDRRHALDSSKEQKRQTLIPSSAFGFDVRNGDPQYITGIERPTIPYSDSTDRLKDEPRDGTDIELITVPALGAEYTAEEIKAMKKPHKRRKKALHSREKAQRWIKSDDRYFGCLSPQLAIFMIFGSLAALGVMLYFVIPRVPTIAVQTVTPLVAVPDGGSMETHLVPTNFSMDMKINLRADNTGGWIATKVNKMNMKVYDITTSKLVGEGTMNAQSFPGRKQKTFQFPVSFAYASINATGDATWLHWVNACGPKYTNTARQALSLQLSITMDIAGLIGSKGTSAQLADLECPFTLQAE